MRGVEIAAGEVAVIGGTGPIGLLTAAGLKARGITTVISAISQARRGVAQVADRLVDPSKEDLVAAAKELAGGEDAAAAFDCAGVQPVFDALLGGYGYEFLQNNKETQFKVIVQVI